MSSTGPSPLRSAFTLRGYQPAAVCARIVLVLLGLGADYALLPSLYSSAPLCATAAFGLLVLAGRNQKLASVERGTLPLLSRSRLLAFCLLHAVLLVAAKFLSPVLISAAGTYSIAATGVASLKTAVLVPALVFFPAGTWRALWQRFRPELVASLVVLFTFFPNRAFQLASPWYSNVVGRLAFLGSRLFVGGLGYGKGTNPTITGPHVDVEIIFDCLGYSGIRLFDFLFSVVVVVEWSRLNKLRALGSYVLGLFAMGLANLLRIVLLVVVGNLISYSAAFGPLHAHAGWILNTLFFTAFLLLTLGWMRGATNSASPECRP